MPVIQLVAAFFSWAGQCRGFVGGKACFYGLGTLYCTVFSGGDPAAVDIDLGVVLGAGVAGCFCSRCGSDDCVDHINDAVYVAGIFPISVLARCCSHGCS